MIYLRARYYSPAQGRFITQDPFAGSVSIPATLNAYTYALDNPLVYTDPSGKYVESPLDLIFIGIDIASIAWDISQISKSRCYSAELNRQLYIDTGALLLDILFLALPGATGGGMALRFALAGTNMGFDIYNLARMGYGGLRIAQAGIKGVQLGGKLSYFANRSRNSKQPFLPGMEGPVSGEEHHFISNKSDYWPEQFTQITEKYKLDLNGSWNKSFLEGHKGRHTNGYHLWILERLRAIDKMANGDSLKFLDLFQEMIKKPIMENPGLPYK